MLIYLDNFNIIYDYLNYVIYIYTKLLIIIISSKKK